MSENELEAARTQTLALVRDHLTKLQTLHHHYELFRGRILPLAEQTVAARQRSYEADQATFLDLIMAQRTLRDAEAMALQHLTDYRAARAELEAMLGTSLDLPHHHSSPSQDK